MIVSEMYSHVMYIYLQIVGFLHCAAIVET